MSNPVPLPAVPTPETVAAEDLLQSSEPSGASTKVPAGQANTAPHESSALPPVEAIIACAMVEEMKPFLGEATAVQTLLTVGTQPAHTASGEPADPPGHLQEFMLAQLQERSVLLVLSGIGLTNAASAAVRALTLVSPEIYLLAGTTGGLATKVQVGDVVVGTSASYANANSTIFGYQPGQIPQMPAIYESGKAELTLAEKLADTSQIPVHTGPVLSDNSFVLAKAAEYYRQTFAGALAVDMETSAVAQVCHTLGVPWLSVRAVSDLCEPTGESFHLNCTDASQISFTTAVQLLEMLP